MANRIVELAKPLDGHEVVKHLEFREPTWADYVEIGEPYIWTPRGDGYSDPTPILENVKAYAERLIARGDQKGDPLLLGRLGLADSRKVRDAIMGFFLDEDPAVVRSTTSQTSSSSGLAGAPSTSAA
ncbi:hypothetical protein [Hansschlegelia zhihuaiae]|uniref:Uncharacterized protein n=1 Tax=Hansschlegelia zhihuaiae TaxID=405005 RepID=A0A4Q0M480_9HYPH|nr:hypothetical protein [Hansschlegelia zhihuaiae]RXF67685.1 hypothetical protein EK403_21010 [Hansschlegelia zhihuaiae]